MQDDAGSANQLAGSMKPMFCVSVVRDIFRERERENYAEKGGHIFTLHIFLMQHYPVSGVLQLQALPSQAVTVRPRSQKAGGGGGEGVAKTRFSPMIQNPHNGIMTGERQTDPESATQRDHMFISNVKLRERHLGVCITPCPCLDEGLIDA